MGLRGGGAAAFDIRMFPEKKSRFFVVFTLWGMGRGAFETGLSGPDLHKSAKKKSLQSNFVGVSTEVRHNFVPHAGCTKQEERPRFQRQVEERIGHFSSVFSQC